ncbi:MAG: radical SAM protein [candidate division Zixibacteria bacterium]|nr:radical SAM protein [candidate division Zixibacteria bacterium]
MTEFKFFPWAVVWETTFACNMRCLHCGTSAGKKRPDELTTDEALKLIDELAELGTDNITLSGGEPLLRNDWLTLAKRIKARGMRPLMVTNGLAITEKIVDDFESVPMVTVGVSIDGMEKTHDYIRQREGSFVGAVGAIGMMSKRNAFGYCTVTQVSNINLEELDGLRQALIDAGCHLWRIQLCTSTGRMKSNRELVLSLDNYPKLITKILEFQKKNDEIRVDVGENIGYYGQLGTQLWGESPYLGCYAGMRILGVESNGNIKGCLSMPEEFVEGNIREKSLTEIWNNPDGFAYNRKFTKETAAGACHECKYLPLCRGGCTTTSVSASGCRADNPYCIYQLEQVQGIPAPPDPEVVTQLLKQFQVPPTQ